MDVICLVNLVIVKTTYTQSFTAKIKLQKQHEIFLMHVDVKI